MLELHLYRKHFKNGSAMIEALCSISILSILLLFAFSLRISAYKLSYKNNVKNNNIQTMEKLIYIFRENGYDKINELEKNSNYYISNDKLDFKDNNIKSIGRISKPDSYPYIEFNIDEKNSVCKVFLTLKYKLYNKEESNKCEIYIVKD